jgi:hypothetical protein
MLSVDGEGEGVFPTEVLAVGVLDRTTCFMKAEFDSSCGS